MKNLYIHPTATVNKQARLGGFSKVWHYSHVDKGAVVGENCNLGQNVYVGQTAVIGNACRIGNSVSVFSNVILEDFVFCAPFMVFTHISYPRAVVTRKDEFVDTIVRRGSTLGANCTVVPGIEIGEGAFVAAGAIITKTCKSWALIVGVPGRHVGWVSAFGEKIPLPLKGNGSWVCERTGDRYVLEHDVLRREVNDNDILLYEPGKQLERIKF